jgi:parallel beta-helix repeat protein
MKLFMLALGCRKVSAMRYVRGSSFVRIAMLAIAVGALLALDGGQALAAQGQAPAAQPACGATISADTTLGGDLTNCPGDGIVIGDDNITLDLNGHTIDGDATPGPDDDDAGIRNLEHHGVTIEGGTVQEFVHAVVLDGASGNLVRRLTAVANGGTEDGRAILLRNGSDENVIEDNDASNNGRSSIALLDSDSNVIRHNTMSGNGVAGFGGFNAHHNRVERNVVANNGGNGLFWSESNDNRIDANSVSGNPESGILLDTSSRNTVTRNHVFGNGDDLNIFGDDNTVTGNLVSDAAGCDDGQGCGFGISVEGGAHNLVAANIVTRTLHSGIRLDAYGSPAIGNVFRGNIVRAAGIDGIAIDADQVGPVVDTVLDRNITTASSDDGIDIESPATTLTRNIAVHNGDLGIEAVPGAIDGGGNHAAGNGNPAQCTNVAC